MERLITVQAVTQRSMDQMAAGDVLTMTLKDLRGSLDDLRPTLSRLSGPVQLVLVPTQESVRQ